MNGSHVELPCNEVTDPEQHAQLAAQLSGIARTWWASMTASPHAMRKPTLKVGVHTYRGLVGLVSPLPANAAHERTPGRVKLLSNGAKGFQEPGDRLCHSLEVCSYCALPFATCLACYEETCSCVCACKTRPLQVSSLAVQNSITLLCASRYSKVVHMPSPLSTHPSTTPLSSSLRAQHATCWRVLPLLHSSLCCPHM